MLVTYLKNYGQLFFSVLFSLEIEIGVGGLILFSGV